MAGTLTVQNLQGPTSGANANKIIVPSGQTLDVSGGTFTPSAGQVVQVVQTYNASSGYIQTTSTTLVGSGITRAITPKHSDSLILVSFSVSMVHSDYANYVRGRMYVKVGSGSYAAMPNANTYHIGYQASAHAAYSPFVFNGQYSVSSVDTLTFQPYFRSGDGGNARLAHANASYALTLMEIAQ